MQTEELYIKHSRVRALLRREGLDALLLRRVSSFAWFTGGAAGYVTTNCEIGPSSILITPDAKYVITDTIEAPRLREEEKLEEKGFILRIAPWYESQDVVAQLTSGLRVGCDGPYPGMVDLSASVSSLRRSLLRQEVVRFGVLGRACGSALEKAARSVTPGLTEYEISSLVAQEAWARGITPILILVAVDQRVFDFRHPLPTDMPLQRYAMLVLCGRNWGLIASCTRLVHFGPLPADLKRKQESVARVDATLIAGTRPGVRVADIFGAAVQTYAAEGYPEEWTLHHQGGCAGYEGRECKATLECAEVVHQGEAFAWNPSITGTKSEDTIIVGSDENEIITATGAWPTIAVEINGRTILRPAVLELPL
ncbi:MAG: M24 family metallopeptidase [Chloroflexota bacterium]|nr:M24 family metallopeptidase [Anaerolineae bacterium]